MFEHFDDFRSEIDFCEFLLECLVDGFLDAVADFRKTLSDFNFKEAELFFAAINLKTAFKTPPYLCKWFRDFCLRISK